MRVGPMMGSRLFACKGRNAFRSSGSWTMTSACRLQSKSAGTPHFLPTTCTSEVRPQRGRLSTSDAECIKIRSRKVVSGLIKLFGLGCALLKRKLTRSHDCIDRQASGAPTVRSSGRLVAGNGSPVEHVATCNHQTRKVNIRTSTSSPIHRQETSRKYEGWKDTKVNPTVRARQNV